MAAGVCGGDWDRIESTWDLPRYRRLEAHWLAHGPPLYLSMAAFVGYRGRPKADGTGTLSRPEDIAQFLQTTPGPWSKGG